MRYNQSAMRILYLDLDTLRPDHLSGYGYPRPTSPHLDSVIRRGLRFSRAFAQSSPCVPSRAALFSGRFDVHNGVVTHWGPGGEFRPPAPGGPGRGGALGAPMLAKHLNAAVVEERADVAKLNAGLKDELVSKGMQFNGPDPALFREALRKAGFYAEWKKKYGDEAWAILEKAVGSNLT